MTEYRNEMKYIIDPQTAHVLQRRLMMCCGFDRNADTNGYYTVTSLYFDDFNNSYLNDNIVGQIKRKKFRIRVYNRKDDFIRLEKKIKHNQGGIKTYCMLTRTQYNDILGGRYIAVREETDDALLKEFCNEALLRKLRPKVIVEYDRQTYVYNYGTVRITLDYNVRYGATGHDLFTENAIYAPAVEEDQVVMEVKYTGFLPGHIKVLVQQGVASRQGVSKYSLCRARNY
jgi:hypothetical protein